MTILELTFPAGRYHATPWGRHVNEGVVEWPPSPWRILRALVATWYLKAQEEIEASTMQELVAALAEEEPIFHLPYAAASHTRHYMPVIEGSNEKNAKIFDAFVQVPPEKQVLVVWSSALPDAQREALRLLAVRMGYLGRAESLVMGRVLNALPQHDERTHWIAAPMVEGELIRDRWQVVRTLCAMPDNEYKAWCLEYLGPQQQNKGGKKGTKKKPVLPEALFGALHADTADLQKAGWNLPPGARFVDYTRPENAFTQRSMRRRTQKAVLPTMARFEVVSSVPPRIIQAVSVTERVHDALCKWSEKDGRPAPVFIGANSDGAIFMQHEHAHIFCEANGKRDIITHISVWAPMGFDEQATWALRRLNKVWGHGGHDIRLVLHGIGMPESFTGDHLFGLSRIWRSVTPFVSTRHAKTFRDGRPKIDDNGWQVGSAGHDLLRLLALDERYAGASIRKLEERSGPYRFNDINLRSLQFQTQRTRGAGSRGQDHGAAFEITFPKEVAGPIALGYGAHFGLGLFTPVK